MLYFRGLTQGFVTGWHAPSAHFSLSRYVYAPFFSKWKCEHARSTKFLKPTTSHEPGVNMGQSRNNKKTVGPVDGEKVVAKKPTRTNKKAGRRNNSNMNQPTLTAAQAGETMTGASTNRQGSSSNNNNNLLTQPTPVLSFHADPSDHYGATATSLEVLIRGMPRAWKHPGWSLHSKMCYNASWQPSNDFGNAVKHAFHLRGLPIHTFGDSLL